MNQDNLFVHSIFYDSKTRAGIPAEHIPIDNTNGSQYSYEIEPIYETLAANNFPENAWVGFFSPRLYEKTKLRYRDLKDTTSLLSDDTEIFLFSSHYELVSLFINPWIQGEACHPGLLEISMALAKKAGYSVNLETFIGTAKTSVFSHYFLAKPRFWREWQRLVRIYMEMINSSREFKDLGTFHREKITSIHPFVVERIPSMILANGGFESAFSPKLYEKQYPKFDIKGELLTKMDLTKQQFIEDREIEHLNEYARLVRRFIFKQTAYDKGILT